MKRHSVSVVLIALAAVAIATSYGRAQIFGSSGITQAQLNAAIAQVMTVMPQPAAAPPPSDSTSAAVGSSTNRYMLEDSVRPARYRSTTGVISGGNGVATLTWSTPFVSTPLPLGDPTVVNTTGSASSIQCNWTSVTTTGATVLCRQPLVNLTISLGALNLLPYAANGLVVSGTAVQPL